MNKVLILPKLINNDMEYSELYGLNFLIFKNKNENLLYKIRNPYFNFYKPDVIAPVIPSSLIICQYCHLKVYPNWGTTIQHKRDCPSCAFLNNLKINLDTIQYIYTI